MIDLSAGKRFVFICGLHRSGTSVLFQCLRDHPMISGFKNTNVPEDEGQHLQTVFPRAMEYGGPGRFGFNPNSYLDEDSPLVSEENAKQIFAEWSGYWDLNKPVLLEKSPPNLVRTRFLQALFPNSFFIVLLRHPVAVAYATQKWAAREIEFILKHWVVCHDVFETDRSHLKRVITLKYELFVEQPLEHLNRIYDFLDLPSCSISTEIKTGLNNQYFEKWTPDEETKCEYLEDEIKRFGYSLHNLNYCQPY